MRKKSTPTRARPAPEPPHQWLTIEQVATLLQVSKRFVQECIQRGELPACTLSHGGKIRRVAYDDLSTFMAAHRTPTTAATATH